MLEFRHRGDPHHGPGLDVFFGPDAPIFLLPFLGLATLCPEALIRVSGFVVRHREFSCSYSVVDFLPEFVHESREVMSILQVFFGEVEIDQVLLVVSPTSCAWKHVLKRAYKHFVMVLVCCCWLYWVVEANDV